MDRWGQQKHSCKYPATVNDKELKRKTLTPTSSQTEQKEYMDRWGQQKPSTRKYPPATVNDKESKRKTTLTPTSSQTEQKEYMDRWGQQIPTRKYPATINDKKLKRKNVNTNRFMPSPGTRVPMIMGKAVVGPQPEPGMRKYGKWHAAIKNHRKKSALAFNRELQKMFLSQQKKESGRGTTMKLFNRMGKKIPHSCMDEYWGRWWQCGT
jgi:hypothetical protein